MTNSTQTQAIDVYTDGGSRGNPGPAAIGVVIKKDTRILWRHKSYIGRETNNVAEYKALIVALNWLKENKNLITDECIMHIDSLLVVQQVRGVFRVKNAALSELLLQVKSYEVEIGKKIIYHHIPRSKNHEADALVNEALDKDRVMSFSNQ